jgi:hypothetical protein
MRMFTLANPTSHREQIPLAPRLAPTCRCAGGDGIGYRDEDGDWTCSRYGRQLRGHATVAGVR